MTESIAISLPSALWLAKLTPSGDPNLLLAPVDGLPTNWLSTPLATAIGFGGMLSLADVGHGVEPNLSPTGSLPLPGDRIVLARTGPKVEVFGALEITGITIAAGGGVRIGHRPLLRFTRPIDLREVRTVNHLLGRRWDALFGRVGRDRRLLPLSDQDVALCFTAMGFSLEALFSESSPSMVEVEPASPWTLDEQIDHITIETDLVDKRIADGVAVYHGAHGALAADPELLSVDVARDLLLSLRRPDRTDYTVAQSVCLGEPLRTSNTGRHLGASMLVAVETENEWSLVELDPSETEASL
ncbi:MAG: hypothetical protein ACN4GZ_00945 [Acidimicrobiales bacterium]